MVFWDYVTRLEEETRRLVRCYCSKEMNEEFPACTDKDCNDLIRLNQELRRDMERYLSIYETSSPSYIFMAGMDSCIRARGEDGQ